jgi:hypothetical protein
VTKGDTLADEDLPITSSQLLGRVLTVWRSGRAHQAPFPYSRSWSLVSLAAARCLRLASRITSRSPLRRRVRRYRDLRG